MAVVPNALLINPDVGASLTHAVAARYARPAIGAIVHELFHMWHTLINPTKFLDLNWTELVDEAKAVLAEQVSRYAARSPHEAVAEIATAEINGEALGVEVRRILEAFVRPT